MRILSRPIGLQPRASFVKYLANPVLTLSPFNYKVEASLGPTAESSRPVLTVFDTGAGPNLVRAGWLPPEALARVERGSPIVGLRSASQHTLDVLGVLTLSVNINGYKCRQPFIVTNNLGCDAILGTTFIDKHVENLFVRRRLVILNDGTIVPIQKRSAREEPSSLTP